MAKISVGRTVSEAYAFSFGKFLGNLGVVWLPVALIMLGAWYFVPLYLAFLRSLAEHMNLAPDPAMIMAGMQNIYRFAILFWLGIVLLRTQIMLGLTRRALGLATGPSFVFVSFGKPFWRLCGAYFAVTIILWAVEMALIVALVIIALATGGIAAFSVSGNTAALAPLAIMGATIGVAVVLGALFYIAVRLTFLLTPVIVAEERFDLIRPWRLAGGNFWRIFAIGVGVFVPLMILIAAVSVPVYLSALWPLPHLTFGQHDAPATMRELHALFATLIGRARAHWYMILPLPLVSSALLYGVAAGAAASAYRALVPEPAPAA